MKSIRITLGSLMLALLTATPAGAGDIENGRALHQESCTGCHDASVYVRENRRVTDLAGLGKQVRFCKNTIGISWFDDEVDDVIDYLNHEYYHFQAD
jgi:hypothetical protein